MNKGQIGEGELNYETQDNPPGNITTLPVQDNGKNTAQQEYLRAVFDYIKETERTLARIQFLETTSDLTESDCRYTLDILYLIEPANLPEVENLSREERQWKYSLGALWDAKR